MSVNQLPAKSEGEGLINKMTGRRSGGGTDAGLRELFLKCNAIALCDIT